MSIALLSVVINITASTPAAFDYKNYALQALLQLLYPLTDAIGYESLDKVKNYDEKAYYDIQTIATRVNKGLNSYSSVDTVMKVVYEKIKEYVRERAYNRARIEYKNYFIDEAYAGKIADCIKDELVKIHDSSIYSLPRGCFKDFIGRALDRKVEQYIVGSLRPVYESQFCAQCHSKFPHAARVFLSCGHDVCLLCANKLNVYNNYCPRCKSVIDFSDLRNQLIR